MGMEAIVRSTPGFLAMKKLLLVVVAVGLAMDVGNAGAGMTFKPGAMLKPGQFDVGVQGTYLVEQDLEYNAVKASRKSKTYIVPTKNVKIADDKSYMATVAYGVTHWLNLYAKLGMTDGGKLELTTFEGGVWGDSEIKLKGVFAWALGVKGRVFETRDGLGLLLAAQYLRYDDRKTGDTESVRFGRAVNDYSVSYWQADLAASLYKKLGPVTPYIGLGYEYAELNMSGTDQPGSKFTYEVDLDDVNNNDNLNAFVGLDWSITKNLLLNLQGDFIAQTAVTLGVSWAF